jgi:hypothetical protein
MGDQDKITDAFGRPYPRKDVLASVGEGWHKLVDELIDDLFELGWDGSLHQIKEKFGGLRFYIGGGDDRIHERIYRAEAESLRTCESCGKPGKPTTSGWVRTLCESHQASDRVSEYVNMERGRDVRSGSVQAADDVVHE